MAIRLPTACEEDFESLPPAVRRKFFSNVERLRIRLAQSDPSSPFSTNAHGRSYRNAHPGPGPLYHRPRHPSTASLTRSRRLEKNRQTSRKLRKPGSLQLAYLVNQADSQCFSSLPAKVQQQLFSPEEQNRLRRAYRESLILDAADEAFYRRPSIRGHRLSNDSHLSEATLAGGQPSTVFYESDSEYEDVPDRKMDQSFYDSFRWLDEDGDLDLSLDEYHAHVADSATGRFKSRRRPSFRRSFSISTHALRHRPTASVPPRLVTSPSIPPPSPIGSTRRSISRPSSRRQPSHAPRSSTSSIDPGAQYYQDPDARLKLRVYLASPQKFDEAIEFGFPSSDQNKEVVTPELPSTPKPVTVSPECTGTFLEDDDGTIVGSPGGSFDESSTSRLPLQMRESPSPSVDNPSLLQRRQSSLPGSKVGPQRLPGNREMTLKMTLTRPDLRTDSPSSSPKAPQEDPLQLAALPPADRSQHIWDSDLDEQGMVKKMWRKLLRRA
ncbi:uncharacterized protein N7498_004378 [Penicillium cinerascens]|uniref:Uncharacterized protein n=1 Tax=Penicillium cinerascens TaxID=70096 RepID=A0A9W9T7T3_9EURO|nr:uncharacterized protein N7498_004378 [Penicillium cinerascens]KAJ5212732.1 hypothetical protein N7498_004378 [Penicillium cinerascens]